MILLTAIQQRLHARRPNFLLNLCTGRRTPGFVLIRSQPFWRAAQRFWMASERTEELIDLLNDQRTIQVTYVELKSNA